MAGITWSRAVSGAMIAAPRRGWRVRAMSPLEEGELAQARGVDTAYRVWEGRPDMGSGLKEGR